MSSAVVLSNPNEIVIHSPANGVEIGRVPVMSGDEVRAAVARARDAQVEWAKVPLAERVKKVRRFRDELLYRTQELVDLLVAENGKTPEEAVFMEMLPLTTISTWYCAKAKRLLKPKRIRPWGASLIRTSYLHYAPRGVVAVISPWNFPLTIPLSAVIPALLAGNAVVVKPSEWTPLIMVRAKEIFDRCGMNPDLLQVVTGYGPAGQALIEAGVDKVHFTGSTNVGKKIAAVCGERLIPVTLELGGKAPAIVCDDANLDRTVNCLTWGGFGNSGQVCVSVERILVDKKIAPELTRRLVESISKLRQGDPTTSEVDVGAMTFPKQVDNVERLVEDSRSRGAKILTGGFRTDRHGKPAPPNVDSGKGRYYAPTLIGGVTADMPIARQEIFGPAMPIIEVDGDEEAIRLANDSHLGLNAYVFTRDMKRARSIANRVRAGSTVVNDVLGNFAMAELPFGGVKESGLGRSHGVEGILSMCEERLVNHDRFPALKRDLWMYPYNRKLSKRVIQYLPRIAKLLDAIGWT